MRGSCSTDRSPPKGLECSCAAGPPQPKLPAHGQDRRRHPRFYLLVMSPGFGCRQQLQSPCWL